MVVGALTGLLFLAALVVAVVGNYLGAGAHRSARGTGRTVAPHTAGRAALTIVQVALTTLLLTGGAALANHFIELARLEPGFVPDSVMVAPTSTYITSLRSIRPKPPSMMAS